MALIHETFHALGLKHPGNYKAGGGGTDGPYLPFGQDNTSNTVMTYNFTGNSAATAMPYDIKALQYIYGAKTYNAQNTTYSFNSVYGYTANGQSVGRSTTPMKLTVWDSGGTDTLDFSILSSSTSGYRFDLREGGVNTTQSAFNGSSYTAEGDTSGTTYRTSTNGTAIAHNTVIENAKGSSSNDTIIGNSLVNTLYGNSGNDILYGSAGSDTLIGGLGADTLTGGEGNDTYSVENTGDRVIESGSTGGSDTVRSAITRTLGTYVENLILTVTSAINGTGNNLNNTITGNGAANTLIGATGHDTLIGGLGTDRLTGGTGADRFVLNSRTGGRDTITDFSVVEDTIHVSRAGFGGGLTAGAAITATQFCLGTVAADTFDRFIYTKSTGSLFFDGDGTGVTGQVQLATLSTNLALTNNDIFVIA